MAPEARWDGDADDFRLRIAPARTFALARDIGELVAGGLARHVEPASVVVLAPEADPPRRPGVFARRARASQAARPPGRPVSVWGGPPLGHLRVVRPGHAANAVGLPARARRGDRRGRLMLEAGSASGCPRDIVVRLPSAVASAAARRTRRATRSTTRTTSPRRPGPPTLPELTHSEAEGTLEATAGAILPERGRRASRTRTCSASPSRSPSVCGAGTSTPTTSSLRPAAGPSAATSSSAAARSGRRRTGLAFGGGLDLIVPTARFDQPGPAATTALDAATLRPWDVRVLRPERLRRPPLRRRSRNRRAVRRPVPPGARRAHDHRLVRDAVHLRDRRGLPGPMGHPRSRRRLRGVRVVRDRRPRTSATASAPRSSSRRTCASSCPGSSRPSARSRTSGPRSRARAIASGASASRSRWSTTRRAPSACARSRRARTSSRTSIDDALTLGQLAPLGRARARPGARAPRARSARRAGAATRGGS